MLSPPCPPHLPCVVFPLLLSLQQELDMDAGKLIYQLLNSQESPVQLGSPRAHRGLFFQERSFPHLSRQRCIFHACRTVREFQAFACQGSGEGRLGCLHQCEKRSEGFTGKICSVRSSSSSLASQGGCSLWRAVTQRISVLRMLPMQSPTDLPAPNSLQRVN